MQRDVPAESIARRHCRALRSRPTCPASPSRNWSASSASPTSSSWRRTKIRSARARWRWPPCSARSPTPGCIRTAAATCSSRSCAREAAASTSTQITLGNGSNDVLVLLAEAFLKPGLEAVYSQYAFAVYPDRRPGHRRHRRGACRRSPRIPACRWATTWPPWRAPSRRARASCSSRILTIPPAPGCRRRELEAFIAARAGPRDGGARRGVLRIHRRPRTAERHRLAGPISRTSSCSAPSPRPMGWRVCAWAMP